MPLAGLRDYRVFVEDTRCCVCSRQSSNNNPQGGMVDSVNSPYSRQQYRYMHDIDQSESTRISLRKSPKPL